MDRTSSGKAEADLKKSFAGNNSRNVLQSSGSSTNVSEHKQISPVLVAFEQEVSRFIKYIKKKSEVGLKTKKSDEEPLARGSNTLFSMWNTYEGRLPPFYYQEKLLNTGDFLFTVKEYKLAQFHCYGRYLAKHLQRGLTLVEVAELDAEGFYKMHLMSGLDDLALATMVLRAVLGEAICYYHVRTAEDPKLQASNLDEVSHCVAVLKVLRLATQTALHKEELCWLVFNGTVHIYSICRHLMTCGHSSKALEFLLWACMCLESSVPLLTVRYLTWRTTLYTAVCQCYFDIKVPIHAEAFAKRGLAKVNELNEIEKMSTSESTPATEAAFRQAKTKMQAMIFKRVVFETRKRPKGLLRPKTKPNLKDFAHHAWPRTPTERLLNDLQGTAAKFLAILEALSETHRRTLHCEAPTPDAEDTAIDVCAELFFAGMEIIAGGGGTKQSHAVKHEGGIHPSVWELQNTALMELVAKVAHSTVSWSNAASFDPILSAEVTLKLSLLLECKAGYTDPSRVGSAELETPAFTASPEHVDSKQEKSETEVYEKPATGPTPLRGLFTDYSRQMVITLGGMGTGVRDILNKALDILEQGLRDVAKARDTVIDTKKRNIADVSWIKPSPSISTDQDETVKEAEIQGSTLLERMIEALHMELLFIRHRIAVKLSNLGKETVEQKKSAKKQKEKIQPSDSLLQLSEVENTLLAQCNRNPLSKALLLMHMARQAVTSRSHVGTEHQAQLLQESQELIIKSQQQERKVSSWNRQADIGDDVPPCDVPPAPLLVYRSSSVLVFKAATFKPKSGEKVAWYRLFARSASGNNVKVRLNDYQLPGTGEEIPAAADMLFYVRGLKPDEKYMAAMAAYNEQGKLIGGSIGLTCRPVLAAHPLPTLMAWGYLAQLSFSSGVLPIAKSAASVLWNHFVREPELCQENTNIQSASSDLCISLQRIDEGSLGEASPVLARLFLQSIFISVDIRIREGHLFCDTLCANGPLYNGQVARLEECQRLLLAIQVAGWLNDNALCLQAVVQCYGLLAPLIHQKIPAKPVVQVLLRCHAVLQEVPSLTRHRKSSSTSDSLSHMIATVTYYIAKILRMWNEQGVAGAIIELGKKMLNLETAPDSAGTMTTMQAAAAMATATLGGPPPTKTTKKKPGPTKKPKVSGGKGGLGKLEKEAAAFSADAQNEELKALEAYILKLSQQALNRDDEELTGSEDPSVLYSVVANLPPRQAYKEVLKFKRRTRFLGFFVQVLAKALQEGLTETALEWTNDTIGWIVRRNEMLLASNKPTIVRQAVATAGPEEEKIKKFATAIVEFSKPPTRSPQKSRRGETGHDEKEDAEIAARNKQEMYSRPPPTHKKSIAPSTVSRRVI
ncbi:unnamed protein product, partial [Porites evermanni]